MVSPLAAFAAVAVQVAPSPEARGVWVVRTGLASPQAVDTIVDRAHQAGLNALFLQVRGRGDAFYTSQLVPRSDLLVGQPKSFDPLARAMERADRYGMKVHAWVNALLTADFGRPLAADHVVVRHPEWLMVPRAVASQALDAAPAALPGLVHRAARGRGDVEGYYLSPSAPGVAGHLEEVVRELVGEYRVDGLHFDFIRHPNAEYDYSRPALEAYARERRAGGNLLGNTVRAPGAWADYQRNVLTGLLSRLAEAARQERPGIIVSAAVYPDPDVATAEKFQTWPAWMRLGILDALCPMVYTENPTLFRDQVEAARSLIAPSQLLWTGIGAYRLSTDETVARVWDARVAGASGVIVFSHESLLRSGAVRRLRDGAFATERLESSTGSGDAAGRQR